MATTTDERSLFAKLEAVKDIRSKTIQLEKVKNRLLMEIESQDQEEKCLSDYKQEMELLLQEKMSHVEELRQIHADINAMESIIKQSEDSRARSLTFAIRLHEEYLPLKNEVDRMRRECLGLGRLPELHEEEGSIITPQRYSQLYNSATNKCKDWIRPLDNSATTNPLAATFLPPPSNRLNLVGKPPPPPVDMGNRSQGGGTTGTVLTSTSPHHHGGGGAPAPPPAPTFRSDVGLRQQPPPMKSCLSCHQQIHRNAPICPLCKAKSRSRNPKKPKKKEP